MTSLLTERAEDARASINRTLGLHQTLIAQMAEPRRRRRLGAPVDDRSDVQRQSTLLRLISIAESFSAVRLAEEVEAEMGTESSKAMLVIWEAAIIQATSTWNNQEQRYKEWLRVNVKWNDMHDVAQARNAIAHGLGELTRQQLKQRTSIESRLRRFNILLEGHRVLLDEETMVKVADACKKHIETIDRAVSDRP